MSIQEQLYNAKVMKWKPKEMINPVQCEKDYLIVQIALQMRTGFPGNNNAIFAMEHFYFHVIRIKRKDLRATVFRFIM